MDGEGKRANDGLQNQSGGSAAVEEERNENTHPLERLIEGYIYEAAP